MVTPAGKPQQTTQLDDALVELRLDMNNSKAQSRYYDLFLNSTFYVPTLDEQPPGGAEAPAEGQVLPLVMEAQGNDYLMLFDTVERLKDWTETGKSWVEVPGHVLAATSMPPLHWALNVGTDYSKQFIPDEIAWLREAVERCNAAAAAKEE